MEKISKNIYLERMLRQHNIDFTPDLSGTLFLDIFPYPYVMVSWDDQSDDYHLGLYDSTTMKASDGEEYEEPKHPAIANIYFDREDLLARFLVELRDGGFDGWSNGNIEKWREETREQHLRYLLREHPETIKENYPNWLQDKLIENLKEKLDK